MPKLGATSESQAIVVSPMTYSPINLHQLGASEYTIVGLAVDDSSSIQGSVADIRKCIAEVINACAKSPRADNLLIRPVAFNHQLTEVHPFKELKDIHSGDYDNLGGHGGGTALNDAAVNTINAVSAQGRSLIDNDYDANGIVIVITDGQEFDSTMGVNDVYKAREKAMEDENLESIATILVGVNTNPDMDKLLKKWKDAVGFTQYVGLKDANANTLAKLASFISKSISAQSQALLSGGMSKQLPLTI